MRRDRSVSVIEVIIISTQPNGPKAVGKKSPPVEPVVEEFTFQFFPFFLPVGSIESSEQILDFECRKVNKLIPE